MKEPVSDTVC